MGVSLLSVSVVAPVRNEENCLREFIERSIAVLDNLPNASELIMVDDGSEDSSGEIIADAVDRYAGKVSAVFLNRSYGQHAAVLAGFAHANGDIIVTLDSDLQNPPEEIPRLLAEFMKGYDVVGSVRKPRHDTFLRRLLSQLLNRAASAHTGMQIGDFGCMLRAYSREVVENMIQCAGHNTFIPVLAHTLAGNPTEIEVSHSPRASGESKYGLFKLVSLLFDFLSSLAIVPLRMVSFIGACLTVLGACIGVPLLFIPLLPGVEWTAENAYLAFSALIFLVGAQFMAMGLIGEYIGRVRSELQGRPLYVVSKTIGSSHLRDAEKSEA